MDEYSSEPRFSCEAGSNDVAHTRGASDDAAYICDIAASHAAMPAIAAIGSVLRRASLIAAAVHACEVASAESRIRRQSWIGHSTEARA